MTETRVIGSRGYPQGRAIYSGSVTVTITGTDTTGSQAVVFDPLYDSGAEPRMIVSVPEHVTDGASTYISASYLTSKAYTGFTLNIRLDQAPGLYFTTLCQADYLVIAQNRSNPQD
jgi:hypothetical protein